MKLRYFIISIAICMHVVSADASYIDGSFNDAVAKLCLRAPALNDKEINITSLPSKINYCLQANDLENVIISAINARFGNIIIPYKKEERIVIVKFSFEKYRPGLGPLSVSIRDIDVGTKNGEAIFDSTISEKYYDLNVSIKINKDAQTKEGQEFFKNNEGKELLN